MSLDFDYSKVTAIPSDPAERTAYFDAPNTENTTFRNPQTGTDELYDNWTVLETLIWRCMAVGLRGITEENLQTFIERSAMWTYVHGGVRVNAESVAKHIGLRTNVTNETDAQWRKHLLASIERSSSAGNAAQFVSRRKAALAQQD